MVDGVAYYIDQENRSRVYALRDLREKLIEFYHLSYGHIEMTKTIWVLRRKFNWPDLNADVIRYVNECQMRKTSKHQPSHLYGPMKSVTATEPNESVSIDLYGPLPSGQAGVDKILVMVDVFSNVKLFPSRYALMQNVINAIEKYIRRYGEIGTILRDSGRQFTSSHFLRHLERLHINARFTSVYHPA